MSLLAAHTLLTNQTVSARVESAIRKIGAARMGAEGAPGEMARAAFRDPTTLVPTFMTRLATNADVVGEACPACGDASSVPDDTIEWIIGTAWDSVAQDLYGSPKDS